MAKLLFLTNKLLDLLIACLILFSLASDHDQPNVDTTIIQKVPCVEPNPDEESPTHSQEGWTANSSSSSSPPTVKVDVEDEAPPLALHQGSQPALSSISPSSCCTIGDGDEETASARSSCSGSPSSPNKPTTKGSSGGASSPTPSSLALHNKQRMPGCSSVIAAAQDLATQTQGTSTGRELHKDTSCSTDSTPAKATIPTNDKQPGNAGSFSSRSGRSGTLESLIRAEALGRRGATAKRILEEDDDKEAVQSLATKLNPANLLMRLVACRSTMSARQHFPACGLMRTTHKPRYLTQHVEFLPSSPVLSPLGTLIMRPRNADGARGDSDSGDCSHCRGRLLQTADNRCESGKVMSTIVRPSSYCDHNR